MHQTDSVSGSDTNCQQLELSLAILPVNRLVGSVENFESCVEIVFFFFARYAYYRHIRFAVAMHFRKVEFA